MLKNITLSAEEKLIKDGRKKAREDHTTINEKFRQWLAFYVNTEENAKNYHQIMKELNYVVPDGKFTRDDLNER